MSAKRNQYTQEFKDSAVKLITEQGYKLSEASRSLGVNVSVLRRWKIASESGEKRSNKEQASVDLHAELARLKKENHRLKLEREILKKAAVYSTDQRNTLELSDLKGGVYGSKRKTRSFGYRES